MATRLWIPITTLLTATLALAATPMAAQLAPLMQVAENSAGNAMENTGRNVRDQAGTTLTPEDQMESEADVNITANIRKAVVDDKALSVNAQNAKIITHNGVVTLRGPVESQTESMRLQALATDTQGVVRVQNQLDIKAP
jgi:hyperosmotically inducible periplasmic protein